MAFQGKCDRPLLARWHITAKHLIFDLAATLVLKHLIFHYTRHSLVLPGLHFSFTTLPTFIHSLTRARIVSFKLSLIYSVPFVRPSFDFHETYTTTCYSYLCSNRYRNRPRSRKLWLPNTEQWRHAVRIQHGWSTHHRCWMPTVGYQYMFQLLTNGLTYTDSYLSL